MGKIVRRDSSRYFYADYYDNDGRRVRRSLGTANRREAEERLVELLYQKINSKTIIRDITFRNFMFTYLNYVKEEMRPKTYKIYKGILNTFDRFLSEDTFCVYLKNISRDMINKYKHFRMNQIYRGKKLSPHTVNIEIRTLKAFFNEAVRGNYIRSNPVKDVALAECVDGPTKMLSIEDYKRIIREARMRYSDFQKDSFVALLLAYIYTGARKEELLNLIPDQIDFQNNTIHIYSHDNYKTKTGRSRFVKLHTKVIEEIKKLKKYPNFVFYSETGKPYKHHFYRKFKRIVKDLNIGWVTVHHLRHSLASYLAKLGVSFTTIAQILGHRSINTTLKFYQHTTSRECANAIDLIPDFEKVSVDTL